MYVKKILSAVAVAAGVVLPLSTYAQTAVPQTVFEEEFDRYAEFPEIFHKDSHITENCPSMKSIVFTPEKNSRLKTTWFVVQGNAVNFDFTFKFKFSKDSKRAFTLLLDFKDPTDASKRPRPIVANINIGERNSSMSFIAGYPRPTSWNNDLGPLPTFTSRQWYQAKLSVRGGYATLHIWRDGKWYLESYGQIAKPGVELTGFNIASATQVQLDAFKVVKFDSSLSSPAVNASFLPMPEMMFQISGLSYPASFSMTFNDGSEKLKQLKFNSFAETKYTHYVHRNDTDEKETIVLPDAGFKVSLANSKQKEGIVLRTRPNLSKYTEEGQTEVAAKWDTYPAGSEMPIWIRLKYINENTIEVWLNEKMAFPVTLDNMLKRIEFSLPCGKVESLAVLDTAAFNRAGFLPLNPVALTDWSQRAKMKSQAPAVLFPVNGIPFENINGLSFPLSVCEENRGSFMLECDGYLSRSAFDAMPSSVHFSVPTAQYTKAYALCSVTPNASPDFVPVITARLTNFAHPKQGRAQGICHHSVTLPAKPGNPLPENVWIVGGTPDNPVYLVEFTFDTGSIEDVVFRENNPQMDFELLGELYQKDSYYLNKSMKPSARKSSVVLHAATLRNTPCELRVDQGRIGATWYLEEKPWMNIHVNPLQPGKYTYTTEIFDFRGKKLSTFKGTGDKEMDVRIDIPQKEYGWYSVKTTLTDARGNVILVRPSAFVLLPPDTRKAGMESPYHAWFINGAHITPLWDIWKDLAKRQGTRRSTHQLKSEENVKDVGFTLGQFPSPASKFETEEQAEKLIKEWTARFPHCKAAVIFHESLNGPYPLELVGGKTVITPEIEEMDKKRTERAIFMAKMWRKYAPDVQLVVGNTGTSLGGLARLFRQKFPRELIDKMGEESCGLTQPPEYSTAIADWSLMRLAEIYGYKGLMPTATYEWKCRNSRDINPVRLAAFGVRDDLIAHAWHHDLMNGGGSSCPANSYWNTVWCGGSYTRYPLLEPQPGVAAIATMTLVLDCAKCTKMIDSGSNTVYVEEFKRGDEYIYAFWTARGDTSIEFTFDKAADILRTEMLGAQHKEKTNATGLFKTTVSEEPAYITTNVPLKTAVASLKRTFPREKQPEGQPYVISTMDDANAWTSVKGVDHRIVVGQGREPLYKAADFTVQTVTDEEKGKAMEITLSKSDCPELVEESGFIKLKTPVTLPGKPHTIGISCKGNSSWGKVYFELTDAEGEVWLSAGNGGFGCATYDWPCSVGFNYDGWHTLVFPITKESPIKVKSPGENEWQWQRSTGNGVIDYPVKVTGVGFSMYRKVLVIDKMKEAGNTIRLQNLVCW